MSGLLIANRVEICGGIASGKTTVMGLLKTELNGIAIKEKFGINPFISAFYRDVETYSFETELAFLLIHYHQLKNRLGADNLAICDFAFVQDSAFVDLTLANEQKQIFNVLYDRILVEVGLPIVLIHLSCDPSEQLTRIRHRSRKYEQKIPLSYLSALNDAIDAKIVEIMKTVQVVQVDTDAIDLRRNKAALKDISCRVSDALSMNR